MNRAKLACNVVRYLGPRFAWIRGGLYLRKRLGFTRRTFAARSWNDIQLRQVVAPGTPTDAEGYARYKLDAPPPFLFPVGSPPQLPDHLRQSESTRNHTLADRMELLARDRCVYFFNVASPATIDWYTNPFDGAQSDPNRPWFELPDYLPEQGDIRMLWEPARAAWAIDCAKAQAGQNRDDAGDIFWRWIDSWMAACPPYVGIHWKCGQESAVRLLAVLLGFWAVARDRATAPERFIQVAKMAWATGYRLFHHISYAISQKNNHAMSEACGLILLGHLFPEFKDATRWLQRGRQVLAREIRRQVYDDGSYVQHSMVYQRVMLQMSLLGLRLAELADRPFPREVYETLGRSTDFLYEMVDPRTGKVPAYGDNDGAWVLPLSECDFHDFRPVIQATHYLVHRELLFPPGPWDEDVAWLFGADTLAGASRASREPRSMALTAGGYYTLRRPDSWAMVRSHTYRDRPAHCDQMHVDLSWKGLNILRDCGTYRYYCPGRPDVEYYFRSNLAHNCVELDGQNALERASRFLWFPWPRCSTTRYLPVGDSPGCIEAVSYDYQRRPFRCIHRRTCVSLADDLWVVVDDLVGRGSHEAVVRWHLLDVPLSVDPAELTVALDTPAGPFGMALANAAISCDRFEVIRGRDELNRVQGFASRYYGQRLPIPTVEASWSGPLPQRVVSTFCPGLPTPARLQHAGTSAQQWTIARDDTCHALELSLPGHQQGNVFLGHAMERQPISKATAS